jgi:hypothetical protein
MRENRTSGTVRGALGNRRSYRERGNMSERCPICKVKFSWHGTNSVKRLLDVGSRKQYRYFCPSCSVEIYYNQTKYERYLSIIGSIMTIFAGCLTLYRGAILPEELALKIISSILWIIAMIAFGGCLFSQHIKQHYYVKKTPTKKSSRPVKSESLGPY